MSLQGPFIIGILRNMSLKLRIPCALHCIGVGSTYRILEVFRMVDHLMFIALEITYTNLINSFVSSPTSEMIKEPGRINFLISGIRVLASLFSTTSANILPNLPFSEKPESSTSPTILSTPPNTQQPSTRCPFYTIKE